MIRWTTTTGEGESRSSGTTRDCVHAWVIPPRSQQVRRLSVGVGTAISPVERAGASPDEDLRSAGPGKACATLRYAIVGGNTGHSPKPPSSKMSTLFSLTVISASPTTRGPG